MSASTAARIGPSTPAGTRQTADSIRPYIGILGVLIGSILATLATRITTLGLADIRGAVHAGFDEGSWITTSFSVGQMFMGVASIFLGAVFGARRVLLAGIALFFATMVLIPFAPTIHAVLVLQALAGIGSGTFIPLTISFIVRNLPARLVIFGIAIYAMNSELSQNVAASLEGWYSDHWSWRWIFWQQAIALPFMAACVWFGIPREPINRTLLSNSNWTALLYAASGFCLIYAGLDQGNRLDWSGSGLVVALLGGGVFLVACFVVYDLLAPTPFLNLRVLFRTNMPLVLLALAGFRFIILSTAYIIPNYLATVQGYRELQVGSVLLLIALPQLVLAPLLALILTRVDPRIVLGFGTLLIGIACLMASRLTGAWAADDFMPSQILQAIGQSFALTGLLVFAIRLFNPADALTMGALFQISRLFGGELGTAFMQTFVRVREQLHSSMTGLHVGPHSVETVDRLNHYVSGLLSRSESPAEAASRATGLLAKAVSTQANVLAFIDGFLAAAGGAFVCLVLVALMRAVPPPSPPPAR